MGLLDFDNPSLDVNQLPGSHYGFSGTKVSTLTATEYTLVTLAVDDSSSVGGFYVKLEECVRRIILSLRTHPRANNLMCRVVAFGSQMREIIGFTPLEDIQLDKLTGFLGQGGSTYLFGTTKNASDASNAYARQLFDADYKCNVLLYCISDGEDNQSDRDGITAADVGKSFDETTRSEVAESMVSILIGVNMTDSTTKAALDHFSTQANFTKFLSLDDASDKALQKIVDVGYQSISLQSQALGSGGPSQAISTLTV